MGPVDEPGGIHLEDLEMHDNPFSGGDPNTVSSGRSGGIFSRLTRNWWRILLLWLVISSALSYGIYRLVVPTFQAFGMVKIEFYQPELFGSSMTPTEKTSPPTYLQTEIETMRSNPVLDLALADSSVAKYPMVRDSTDPKDVLRDRLTLEIVPNTHWIRVSMESTVPNEASDIVNAVLAAYTEKTVAEAERTSSFGGRLKEKNRSVRRIADAFKRYNESLEKRIYETKENLRKLARRDDEVAAKAEQESKGTPAAARPRDVRTWYSRENEVKASFLRDDLERYYPMYDQVSRKLEQLEFSKDKLGTEIEEIIQAEVPRLPSQNERERYLVLAPIAVLVLLLGLFLAFGRGRP